VTKLVADPPVTTATPEEAQAADSAEEMENDAHQPAALQFALAAEDVDALVKRLDRLSGLRAMTAQFQTIVLDTPDHAIAGAGLQFGIRRRLVGGRGGWKRFVEDLSIATPRSARGFLKKILRDAPVVDASAQIATKRRFWLLRFGECRADITLDHLTARIAEKEIVVASVIFASPAANTDFFDFVIAAVDPNRLRLSAESNLQRIYRSAGVLPTPYVHAFAPALHPRMDAATAFRATASACFDQFLMNEAAFRASGDHEAVHQSRVALRRLSACLKFFGSFVTGADRDALLDEFGEIREHLRMARDLDVFIADVITPAVGQDPAPDATALLHEIERRRDRAYVALTDLLNQPQSAALFLRFAIWVRNGDWCRSDDEKSRKHRAMPIVKYAERKFAAMNGKFCVACAELGEVAPEERHKTRIRAKNMRYDAEFMESLTRGKTAEKRLRSFLKTLKELQTVLGDWNDLLVARTFLLSFDVGDEMGLAAAAVRIADHIQLVEDDEFRQKSAQCCQALVESRPFWSKLG
jgi:triphosphatase